jgi:predicted metal-dependent enzyme (double-stranded beta helix superfamily)
LTTETVIRARREAIATLIQQVGSIVSTDGVTRASLNGIEHALASLAQQESLFTLEDFPPSNDANGMALYELNREPGDGITLYLVVIRPDNSTKPHDHTTWAAIAAVKGEETNRVYAREDDGAIPGCATLKLVRTVTVQPGTSVSFLPEDIHSIHGNGVDLIRHLHLYGRPLDRLTGRVGYDVEAGTVVSYNMNFMTPAIVCQGAVAPLAKP